MDVQQPFFFAITAMLPTASAINATRHGSARRLSYRIARAGELPVILQRKVWNRPVIGLLITAMLSAMVVTALDLARIATLGIAEFLQIFAPVNTANAWRAQLTVHVMFEG